MKAIRVYEIWGRYWATKVMKKLTFQVPKDEEYS